MLLRQDTSRASSVSSLGFDGPSGQTPIDGFAKYGDLRVDGLPIGLVV